MLVEVRLQTPGRTNLCSWVDLPVEPVAGLNGRCDSLLTRDPSQLDLIAPVCMLVAARDDDFLGGVPRAIAEMIAAHA